MATYGVASDIVPGPQTVQANFYRTSTQDNITAKAGGGQSTASAASFIGSAVMTRISVCATGGDSVTLPAALPGDERMIFNAGAASCNVFPILGEAIGTGGANAAFAVGIGKGAYFTCVTAGRWLPVLSA